jgi:hypothetical protein
MDISVAPALLNFVLLPKALGEETAGDRREHLLLGANVDGNIKAGDHAVHTASKLHSTRNLMSENRCRPGSLFG